MKMKQESIRQSKCIYHCVRAHMKYETSQVQNQHVKYGKMGKHTVVFLGSRLKLTKLYQYCSKLHIFQRAKTSFIAQN